MSSLLDGFSRRHDMSDLMTSTTIPICSLCVLLLRCVEPHVWRSTSTFMLKGVVGCGDRYCHTVWSLIVATLCKSWDSLLSVGLLLSYSNIFLHQHPLESSSLCHVHRRSLMTLAAHPALVLAQHLLPRDQMSDLHFLHWIWCSSTKINIIRSMWPYPVKCIPHSI